MDGYGCQSQSIIFRNQKIKKKLKKSEFSWLSMFQCLYNLTDLAHLIACFDWFSELDRVFCTNIIIYLFTVNKKVLHSIRQRKLIKVNQRKENHKSVQKCKYFFFIYIDVLLKSKNYHVEKSNKAYLMNICFA